MLVAPADRSWGNEERQLSRVGFPGEVTKTVCRGLQRERAQLVKVEKPLAVGTALAGHVQGPGFLT